MLNTTGTRDHTLFIQKSAAIDRDVNPWLDEHDACAIVAAVRKTGEATHGNLKRAMDALSKMGHRSGNVNGEGDGTGILTDIPRKLWASILEEAGKPGWLSEDRRFFVGHVFIPAHFNGDTAHIQAQIEEISAQAGVDILVTRPAQTREHALGAMARLQAPFFWQVAGLVSEAPLHAVERQLFNLGLKIERQTGVHLASLSSHSVVYKVRGSIETLYQYYPDLRSPDYMTAITLGHARYSTNTSTIFERVQPFSMLGHNGEINTIARLREQARMLGVELVENGSDSQDVDRSLATLIHNYGFSLMDAMELLFPPISSEVEMLPVEYRQAYQYYRAAFGPFAQGPAAMIARAGDECVFSVDALGLRPLWYGETEKEVYFSSEKGVYHLDLLCSNPRPLSPGEKMGVRLCRNEGVEVIEYADLQARLFEGWKLRTRISGAANMLDGSLQRQPSRNGRTSDHIAASRDTKSKRTHELSMIAMGWGREDRDWVQAIAQSGHDPIGSMGYDGPLAALSDQRQNLADYFKEAVAVVTNPSVDREREMEHFSTQAIVGPRADLIANLRGLRPPIILDCPLLPGGHAGFSPLPVEAYRRVAEGCGTARFEDVLSGYEDDQVVVLPAVTAPGQNIESALDDLAEQACRAVINGAQLVVLDDRIAFQDGNGWIDPLLAVAVVDRALRREFIERDPPDGGAISAPSPNLRRQAGLVLRSGAVRNLHDLIMALGLGADAVAPYLLFETALDDFGLDLEENVRVDRLVNSIMALRAGLEKVISTMGIHELRGYGRLFAGIGLSEPVAHRLGLVSYAASAERGLTWTDIQAEIQSRTAVLNGTERARLARENRFYPKVWKAAGQVARGEGDRYAFEEAAETLAKTLPVTLRHIIAFRRPAGADQEIEPKEVDAGLTGHDLPFVIASMSFGSQGESAFRAYAQAAYWLNIIALNGEGGEIQDMMGRYPHNRGLQIASGRFGITAELINSSNLLEIKVGQGAKPGEGGHLPGRKVSQKIADTRHASVGVDLISPSNNHDIYSIEDLAQFIEELKTSNPKARVAVKVPVVPGIGIIAVGIAKAGADIINLTGYDGGTGAARLHSIKHVGLPAEIGVIEAHRALVDAWLRHEVEIWADGGMRTAADVVKMICLGANRIGFGSLAMLAAGCTVCRACQKGTCHVGITTQIASQEEAQAQGMRRFVPCEYDGAVSGLMHLFGALGERVREITAELGFRRTQDLVGRSDLLEQISHFDRLDLTELLMPADVYLEQYRALESAECCAGRGSGPLRRPRNHLTTVISNMVMETVVGGQNEVSFEDDKVSPVDRALGTHLTGALIRYQRQWLWPPGHGGVGGAQESWRMPVNGANGNGKHLKEATLRFYASSIPGNGLGAYNSAPVNIVVEGGAQDGVAKGMSGGRVVILRGYNHDGILIDGSVGKSLAYGAIGGLVIVQGDADSRACIRLSGADVVIGGDIRLPLRDDLGYIGARANVKGFLCEYMTSGRVLVLGDPGPWICAGMTGGSLYLRLQPHLGFDEAAIQRRIARGAIVEVRPVGRGDEAGLSYLLGEYADELDRGHQYAEAEVALALLLDWESAFVKIEAKSRQLDQSVATE